MTPRRIDLAASGIWWPRLLWAYVAAAILLSVGGLFTLVRQSQQTAEAGAPAPDLRTTQPSPRGADEIRQLMILRGVPLGQHLAAIEGSLPGDMVLHAIELDAASRSTVMDIESSDHRSLVDWLSGFEQHAPESRCRVTRTRAVEHRVRAEVSCIW